MSRPATTPSGAAGDLARSALRRLVVAARVRQGWSRVRAGFWPIVQASLAAGLAYAVGHHVLGHQAPFFAPVCAWVCLGFSMDRQVRKVAELAVGVAVGVGLGDFVVHLIGSGWWQVALVLAVSALLARFIDRGPLLATQAGVQAIVIVGLPALSSTGSPLGRWQDAVVGGLVALLVAVLTPGDPRRRPRALGAEATVELAQTLEVLARGLRRGDAEDVSAALVRGRASEPALDEWRSTASSARELARVSVGRVHRDDLAELERQAVLVDRAMRGTRVLARRALAVAADTHDLRPVADLVSRFAEGARSLATAIGAGHDTAAAREVLLVAARAADPVTVGAGDWQVQSLVVLLRSPLVDALEAAGASPQEARDALTEL